MDELHSYGSLSDSGSDAFDGTVTHIANGKNACNVGLEQEWIPIELPSLRTLSIPHEIWAGQQKAALIPLDDIPALDKRKNHTVEIVVDRLLVKQGIAARLDQ